MAVSVASLRADAASETLDARTAPYSRRVWQSADGLPEDLAQALAQTPDGYLWIGTSGGLVRFDGVRFTVFNHGNEPVFRDDSVYSLFTTRDGVLWAGTEGGGVIRYQGRTFRAFGAKEGLSNAFVRVIFEDRQGTLWVGTDSGLFRRRGEAFTRVDGRGTVPAMNVHSIWQDRKGRLLVGGMGLLVLDGEAATYYSSLENLADNAIRTIRETADGTVWIGTISGLRRLSGGVRGNPFAAPRLIDGVNVCFLRETRRGELWIGTYGRGLMRLRDGKMSALRAPSSLPHDNVLAIFEDTEENVWVGTQGGLLRLSPGVASTITGADGVPLSINTIYADPLGSLFVTALNGRLFQVEGQALVPVRLPAALDKLPIRNVFRDRKGRLWIGTDGQGVVRLDGGEIVRYTMKNGLVNDFIRAFCEDREGDVWIGTDGGLSCWRAGRLRTAGGLVYGSVRSLLLDRRGDLWVATEGGVSRFRFGESVPEPSLGPLSGQKVWALFEDADGGLWMGTQGAGLFVLKGGVLRQFTVEQGLPSNKIYFIAEDERHRLWMSGPSGVFSVSRFDLEAAPRDASGQLAVRVYGTAEGLVTNQMNGGVQPAGVLSAADELWLPSTKGAVRITPDVPNRSRPPSVLIEQVLADDRPVSLSDHLSLPPGGGKLEVHYTSIRLKAPERIHFRYWMEGFERDWTAAGQRRVAYYTNLPSGFYRFHVAAYETDAPRNGSERILVVEWQPHFYETRWFLALCAALATTVAWGAYRLHVRSIRRQFAAVLSERTRLAREMHDTLIQGCVGVSTLLEAAAQAEQVSPDLGHELLDRARAEIHNTVDEARLAVWNLRHDTSSGTTVVPDISQLAYRIGLEAGVRIRVTTAGAPFTVGEEAKRNLLMLVREALQNAIRHGAPTNLSVVLRFARRRVHVVVEDDGRGFDPSGGPPGDTYHYGLIGMRERVETAGGTFQIASSPGRGTKVRFTIPAMRPTEGRAASRT
jgi:ligand-binding sensor domain-containing protein/signal transduction histidine kinase